MNKQEIEKAIAYWKEFKAEIPELKASHPDAGLDEQEEYVDLVISALTQQLNNGWIPVSERLPEKDFDYYFVTMKKPHARYVVEYCLYKQKEHKFYLVADGDDELNQAWEEEAKGIIAWRECPEPYKETL